MPCDVGANQCRLRHIGSEKCGHGLTSNAQRVGLEGFLDELLLRFWNLPSSFGGHFASSVLC